MVIRESQVLEQILGRIDLLTDDVIIGPGDDLAQIGISGGMLLVGVDQVIAGRHFDASCVGADQVARKALGRSLSDVAAMAGIPLAAVATVALPDQDLVIDEAYANALATSLIETGHAMGCPIVGGDVGLLPAACPTCVITVSILATSPHGPPIRRSGAQVGDGVYVTGELGDTLQSDGGGHHLSFEPRIKEAHALRQLLGADLHAMIDISDGLARDAGHMARASGVGIVLEEGLLPRRGKATPIQALGDGEDYELCLAIASECKSLPTHIEGTLLTRVGSVVEAASLGTSAVVLEGSQGRTCVDHLGFEHGGAP